MTDKPQHKKAHDARKEILDIDLPPNYVVPDKELPTKTDSENNNASITSTKKETETRNYTPIDRVHHKSLIKKLATQPSKKMIITQCL